MRSPEDATPPPIDRDPVATGAIEESVPALLGLRRFVVATRLAWTSETLQERVEHDHVITEAPEGARLIRGFKSAPEEPDVTPVTIVERITALHRQNQVRKRRAAGLERWRLNEVYGKRETLTDADDKYEAAMRIPILDAHKTKPDAIEDAEEWQESRRKILEGDRAKTNDLGSEAHRARLAPRAAGGQRMRPYQRSAELAAGRSEVKQVRVRGRHDRRLDRGTEGDTVPGKTREFFIKRAKTRQGKLAARLEELRKLSDIRDEQERRREEA